MKAKYLFVAAITTFSACKKDEVEKVFTTLFGNGALTVSDCAELSSLTSPTGTASTYLFFDNQSGETVKIYWKNYSSGLTLYSTLDDGETHLQQTYVSHVWYITDASENCLTVLAAAQPATTDTVTFVKQ
ncbi:MAG: hypothetical protein GC178_11135 [Flavobacteriales bacterium]|nr:hypothetical protein [Flavobacteriales bacterium]